MIRGALWLSLILLVVLSLPVEFEAISADPHSFLRIAWRSTPLRDLDILTRRLHPGFLRLGVVLSRLCASRWPHVPVMLRGKDVHYVLGIAAGMGLEKWRHRRFGEYHSSV
jgi:hypothetical protein